MVFALQKPCLGVETLCFISLCFGAATVLGIAAWDCHWADQATQIVACDFLQAHKATLPLLFTIENKTRPSCLARIRIDFVKTRIVHFFFVRGHLICCV